MSKGMRIGYVRVSTEDQSIDRQLENIELDKKFIDRFTGRHTNRPQLEALKEFAREGDTIFIHSLDRLARNLKDLVYLIDFFTEKGIFIEFVSENLQFTGKDSPMSKLLLSVIGAVAEFEVSILRERQLEGIRLAKKAGVYKGGKKKLGPTKIDYLRQELSKQKSKHEIAKELGISRQTLYNYAKGVV